MPVPSIVLAGEAEGGQIDAEYLDIDDLIALSANLLGDPPPIRDFGLLGSAAARPQTTVFGEDAYPGIWSKAAALLHSIVKNHALVDGNKRLGWLATAVFLEINGVKAAQATNDDVYEFVLDIAAEQRTIEEIAAGLKRLGRTGFLERGVHRSLQRVGQS